MNVRCSKCGEINAPNATFCAECGNDLRIASTPSVPASPQPAPANSPNDAPTAYVPPANSVPQQNYQPYPSQTPPQQNYQPNQNPSQPGGYQPYQNPQPQQPGGYQPYQNPPRPVNNNASYPNAPQQQPGGYQPYQGTPSQPPVYGNVPQQPGGYPAQQPYYPNQQPPQPQPKKSGGRGLLIGIPVALLLLVGGIVGGLAATKNGPFASSATATVVANNPAATATTSGTQGSIFGNSTPGIATTAPATKGGATIAPVTKGGVTSAPDGLNTPIPTKGTTPGVATTAPATRGASTPRPTTSVDDIGSLLPDLTPVTSGTGGQPTKSGSSTTAPSKTTAPATNSGSSTTAPASDTTPSATSSSGGNWKTLRGPQQIKMAHDLDKQTYKGFDSPVSVADFFASATFYNPYAATKGGFDYGYEFRVNSDGAYAIVVDSSSNWYLYYFKGSGEWTKVQSGSLPEPLSLDFDNPNDFALEASGDVGGFAINGKVVTKNLELSLLPNKGDVRCLTGFFVKNVIKDATTYAEEFKIEVES